MKRIIEIEEKDYDQICEVVNETESSLGITPFAGSIIAQSKPYEERPQGEWEDVICEKGGFYHATCSNCKIRNDIPPVDFAHFCPNCGADMRGGAE